MSDPYEDTKTRALAFRGELAALRERLNLSTNSWWYPYDTLSTIWALDQILTGPQRSVFSDIAGKSVVDIGGADGDFSFFLERSGASRVDLIDNPDTCSSDVEGAHVFKRELGSSVNIHTVDIDEHFTLPGQYDLALFLGVLYHLKNPFNALEKIARHARFALLSTKVTAYSSPSPGRVDLSHVPAGYLLDPYECNDDDTNFWVFTDAGLRRLLHRTGWDILDYGILGGDMATSDPMTSQGDRRAFCFLRSRNDPKITGVARRARLLAAGIADLRGTSGR
jgi:tRNA (mo5U34)-methyltransferase